ncbi:hypothetical protein [Bradyrhizobium sp. NP1]|uniref:hypothetical protein n=1 Tax=Bradyrhizobium sp. NP1 TaxID=3049772 RepID=UPI0025A626CE|nr:hypothetical protein [Bradyrhizobium sp. NP1]WJR76503.1 hypothetical protein QOU61_27620 [Bradyrhizobium sp. NP1]
MASFGPYDPTPANQFVLSYIAQHGREFLRHAQALGLPDQVAHAAASAISEEMRNVHSADGRMTATDAFLDWLVSSQFSNEYFARRFNDSLPQILDGSLNRSGPLGLLNPVFDARKLSNPMSIDVGPGNINLGTASNYLLGYLNNPSYANDPLGLRKYLLNPSGATSGPIGAEHIDFKKFVADLESLDSPLTSAMAMLNVARGYQYLDGLYGSAFTDPKDVSDLQTQAGLLGAFYKMGEARFRSFFPIGVAGGPGSVLPDPNRLAGGKYSHRNFFSINSLLNSGDFEAPPDAASGVQSASFDPNAGRTTVSGAGNVIEPTSHRQSDGGPHVTAPHLRKARRHARRKSAPPSEPLFQMAFRSLERSRVMPACRANGAQRAIAFSSEVGAGSREESASKQESRASVLIRSEPEMV